MYIQEYQQNGVVVLELSGRLDTEGAAALENLLQRLRAEHQHRVVLDMSSVDYVNSTGLRVLAQFIKEVKVTNNRLRLAGLTPNVERVVSMVGLHHFLQPYQTLQAALASF